MYLQLETTDDCFDIELDEKEDGPAQFLHELHLRKSDEFLMFFRNDDFHNAVRIEDIRTIRAVDHTDDSCTYQFVESVGC